MATSGSASSSCTWTPEDDVLLKNAMQEGASFEVLAKGIVPFSRRYTFQELRDRWHSLLYDPDVAAQASVRMFQVEISGFNPVLKLEQLRSFNYKETLGKRNRESVREHYRTMRKKFRKQNSNPPDFSLLEEPRVHDYKEESHGEKYMVKNGIRDHIELLREADVETLHHVFPKHPNASLEQYSTEAYGSYKDEDRNKLIRKDGFLEDLSTKLKDTLGIFEPRREHLSGFAAKDELSNGFLGRPQGDVLNSPHSNSHNVLRFPFHQPTLPLWDEPSVAQPSEELKPVDEAPSSKDCTMQDSSVGVVPTGPLSDVSQDGAAVASDSRVVAEGVDISDSLLNLCNEDELLIMNVDKKVVSQKSSSGNHNSVLINDIKDVSCKHESQTTVSETSSVDHTTTTSDGFQNLNEPASKGSSISVSKVDDEKICCILNTEDPDIPCNDDIFLLIHQSTSCASSADPRRHILRDPVHVSSTPKRKRSAKGINMVKKGKRIAKEFTLPQIIVPTLMAEPLVGKPVYFEVKTDGPYTGTLTLPTLPDVAKPVSASPAKEFTLPQKIVPTLMTEPLVGKPVYFGVKTDCPYTVALTSPPLPDVANPASASPAKSRSLLSNPSRVLNEDLPKFDSKARDNLAACSEPQSAERGAMMLSFPGPIPSASEDEESQSDGDVPCFSDLEAMILEMNVVPFDLDMDNTASKEESQYQDESSKRTIIRLEQCAQACIQRAMERHGAFAVLYGNHSRHYIRKTEVLLGRSTNEVRVDIDLGAEEQGRANKISRKQAIIKLENGSFVLKNLAKSEIYVNDKCVATGHLIGLPSSCLIEIRRLYFLFDVNHKYVDQYTNSEQQVAN